MCIVFGESIKAKRKSGRSGRMEKNFFNEFDARLNVCMLNNKHCIERLGQGHEYTISSWHSHTNIIS